MPTVAQLVMDTAAAYGVDPMLAFEVANKESAFRQAAVSAAGAIGVMQLVPATAAKWGVNPHVLEENIKGGILELRWLLGRYGGEVDKALAGYNCGPGCLDRAVTAHGALWFAALPGETRNYINTILARLGEWRPTISVPALPAAVTQASQAIQTAMPPETWRQWLLIAAGAIFLWLVLDDA